ncbi:MAG: OmpA family protein [Bacteroidales bacterium]|nr:OmpA family protein [Bacteroidales bacterium]
MLKDAYNMTNDKDEKTEIVYLIAECFRLSNDPRKAEMWYKKSISREYPNPVVYLYLADMMKMNEIYEEAIIEYQRYAQLVPDDPRGKDGVKSCELAMEWIDNPNGYIVENIKFFNSKFNDFAPAFASSDYGTVYLTSGREGAMGDKIHGATNQNFTDIFVSTRDRKGEWSEPVPLAEPVNSEFEDGAPAISKDFNSLYFTRCEIGKSKNFGCGIFTALKSGEEWDKVTKIEIAEDSIVIAHPAISADELTLYFVSDMEGTLGGMDIWKVVRDDFKGEWSEPENLGPQINTVDNEVYPYVHADGTLYFSSNGHLGMGGLDIFKAKPNDDGTWTVENMRYPMNSSSDDFGIVFEAENERGYLSSSREGRGDDELFSFMLPPVRFSITGTVKDEKTDKPIANATIRSISSDGTTLESTAKDDGTFKFMLKPSTDYLFIASAEGFLNGKERETTKGYSVSTDFKTTILLSSIKAPIQIENIFWDFNSWELRPETQLALEGVVEILTDNPNIAIELGSHTDSRGGDKFNKDLSQKRAQSVVDFLITKGIDKDRLTAKGYGESQPVKLDDRAAAQSRFFKEGDLLSPDFIEGLENEEQQEMAHQVNRRTEFRVLRTDYVPK